MSKSTVKFSPEQQVLVNQIVQDAVRAFKNREFFDVQAALNALPSKPNPEETRTPADDQRNETQ